MGLNIGIGDLEFCPNKAVDGSNTETDDTVAGKTEGFN
jgi:hypothetical protein